MIPRQLGPIKRKRTPLQLIFYLLFERSAFRTTLLESSRNHNRGLGTGLYALCNDGTDRNCRSSDHSQVHGLRNVANALVGFVSEHFLMLGVDGVNLSAKGVAQQVL
jgi:hypothetical protein